MKLFSLFFVCLGALTGDILTATQPGSLWKGYLGNPIYNPIGVAADDYYPCVIFNKDHFHRHGAVARYKMWHQGLNGIGLSISKDGIFWLLRSPTVVSGEAYHPCVVYDKKGFEDGKYFYKMWFWNGVASPTIDAIQYTYSKDGVTWTTPQSIQQDPERQLVDGRQGSFFYHLRGPGFVMYNRHAKRIKGQPYTFPYVMLFDTASEGLTAEGGYQQIGLAYSSDGILWRRYTNGPIFMPSGRTSDWDGTYAYRPSLVRENGAFHLYYSGSNGNPTSGLHHAHGIGHATSTDGIYWLRDAANPIFISTMARSWRNTRTYTPFVLFDSFSSSHSPKRFFFKMWFTGGAGDFLGEKQGIGYATSPSPCALVDRKNIPKPPRNFEGKIETLLTAVLNQSYSLKTSWKPSRSQNVVSYKIYKNGRVVRTVIAKKCFNFDTFLSTQSSYRKYSISAVNDLGLESCRICLKKKH